MAASGAAKSDAFTIHSVKGVDHIQNYNPLINSLRDITVSVNMLKLEFNFL